MMGAKQGFRKELKLVVFTPRSLNDPKDWIDAFRYFGKVLPELTPHHYGSWEPLRSRFEFSQLETIVGNSLPHGDMLWARKDPDASGVIVQQYGKTYIHGAFQLDAEADSVEQPRIIELLQGMSGLLGADLGILHLVTPHDLALGSLTHTLARAAKKEVAFTPTTHVLRRWLPDMYWGMIFGPPYVELFGKAKLLSAPAAIVQELSPDHIYLQLTDAITDLKTDFQKVDEVRKAVKAHLNHSAFFEPEAGPKHKYQTPRFLLEKEPR